MRDVKMTFYAIYQRNKIYNSIDDLGKLIPRMKNKIKPTESLEIVDQTDNSLVWPWVIYTGLSNVDGIHIISKN